MVRNFFVLFSIIIIVVSCSNKKRIVRAEDYNKYLINGVAKQKVAAVQSEIEFWNIRLLRDTGNFVDMLELANNYLSIFKISGNINALKTGDSLLQKSSKKLRDKKPEILYSLAQTAVTQHQFLTAAKYTETAQKAKGDIFTINLLQFDVNMELGKYRDAWINLERIKDKSEFDYLIRKAKWEDHQGDINEAIRLMELAFNKVKDKKKSLFVWTLSNLGDMYGHAGRVEDAYKAYLQVLQKDPSNLYCLRGIAWIAFSYDKNYAEAKRIIKYILSEANMPELNLMLAQIADTEGDKISKQKGIKNFIDSVSKSGYGKMYNKYLIEIYAEELMEYDKAVGLATEELENRFTPETCDWLAWSYYKKGEYKKAMEYSNGYVYKRTFEPIANMHTAFIFAANGKKSEARKLFNECLESSFELGVVATRQVEEKLRTL